MKGEYKQIVDQILEEIKKSDNILLHLHPRPDGDSIGSALAMHHVLKSLGKKTTVIKGDSPLQKNLSFLSGYDEILEKNYFEIDINDFDLFIILDAASPEMISKIKPVIFPPNLKTIVIDHHVSNRKYAHINLVAPEYVATAEILADIFKIWKIKLNGEIASSLYIGIYTDSGGFKYKTTTPRTYEIAAELVKFIPDFSEIISNTENGNDKKYIEYLGAALNSVEFYLNDKVIVSAVAYDDILKMQIEKEDTSSVNTLNDILRSIEGIEISATFVEEEKGLVRVSMRALRDEFDVSKIAVIFGGGGHKLAAGMNMKMPLDQAKEEFRKAVTEAYGDLLK